MSIEPDDLAQFISTWLATGDAESGESGEDDLAIILHSIARLEELSKAVAGLQKDAVDAARARGQSWAQIGSVLAVTKQAAQQRFRPREQPEATNDVRLLSSENRNEEAEMLARAGREGWRLKTSRPDGHLLERSTRRWEIVRASLFRPGMLPQKKDGWSAISVRFPDAFYQRELKRSAPADTEGQAVA